MKSQATVVLKRIAQSTTALLLLSLVSLEFAIREVRPLRFFNHTGLTAINQNFLVSKLPPALSSPEHADVLLLGSSIVVVPSVRVDDQMHGRRARYDRWYYRNVIDEYSKCDYLQKQLSTAAGRSLKLLELAVVGSIMSDQYLVFKKYLDSGKKPELLICGIAPREFQNNIKVEGTATYSVLSDFTCLKDLLAHKCSKSELSTFALGCLSDFYKNRRDYSTFLAGLSGKLLKHPTTLYAASKKQSNQEGINLPNLDPSEDSVLTSNKPDYTAPPNTLSDLYQYRDHWYKPINPKLFAAHVGYLEKLLALAAAKSIPVVLVEMPLTKENYALLPEDFKALYKEKTTALAAKYNARLIKPGDSLAFTLADFEDSVHLNGAGGNKLFSFVAKEIAGDSKLAGCLSAGQTRIGLGKLKLPL